MKMSTYIKSESTESSITAGGVKSSSSTTFTLTAPAHTEKINQKSNV